MKLSLCPQALYDKTLGEAVEFIAALGIQAIELPVDSSNPWIDAAALAAGDCDALRGALQEHGLSISAVSVHQDGQLLLGPHHRDTDSICPGTPAEKSAFAAERILRAGRIAHHLGVDVVVGFVGCEDYSRWFPWPQASSWEDMMPAFRERMLPVLDELAQLDVKFAQEPHPKQIVYNTETALESLGVLDAHPSWGFNLDPGNLLLAGVDPVIFVAELQEHVLHVHAKDGELVPHNIGRSGLLAHGAWQRPDRGFRFRIPGWGDVPWKRLITELILTGYRGYLAVENEDPVFAPADGLRKAVEHLLPLLPGEDSPQEQWW
ncbi:MAG: sugar phosphate isomerase/epimerase [Planctomycetota bacterium]|nr:sugar phosphate isomerase/epimerase [Planctomycetota bacterium]